MFTVVVFLLSFSCLVLFLGLLTTLLLLATSNPPQKTSQIYTDLKSGHGSFKKSEMILIPDWWTKKTPLVNKKKPEKVGVIRIEAWARPHTPILLFIWQWLRALGTFWKNENNSDVLPFCAHMLMSAMRVSFHSKMAVGSRSTWAGDL